MAGARTPIRNGVLETDLDLNGFALTHATGIGFQPHSASLDTLANSSALFLTLSAFASLADLKDYLALVRGDVGLGSVDNTSDAGKPVSTAQQAALNLKVPTSRTINGQALSSNISLGFADLTSHPITLSGYGITDAEAALGNPGTNGFVLSSTTGGVRSWVAQSGAPFIDSTAIIKGSSDATKQLRIEVDGFTTSTTRVLTAPNYDGTIATLAGTETLANKALVRVAALSFVNGSGFSSALSVQESQSGDKSLDIYLRDDNRGIFLSGDLTLDASLVVTQSILLTSDGIGTRTLNIGTGGTLGTNAYTSTSYQPLDSDLTSWAAITRASGFDTFTATPTLANLKALITDETTVGWNVLTLANPGAVTFIQLNADNSVTTQSASAQRTALSLVPGTDVVAFNGALGTPTSGTLTNCTFPTLNQNTTGSAAKWTTARNLAGNSVDGSAAVAFANKFIVQGTTDAGLSAAQFLGALATGIVKNTTTTGVLSIAVAGDFPTLNQNTTGSAAILTTARGIGSASFDGSASITLDTIENGLAATGFISRTGANTRSARTLTGTANQIAITNGAGVAGDPVFSIPASAQLSIAKLTNLTSNGFVKTSASDGTLSIDASTYLTGNQSITVSGDATGSGTTSIALTVTKVNGTSFAGLATGILKNTTTTGVPSIAVAGDFPTLNQNTTGSAATLTTARAIYGNNFDGSAALSQIIASTYGGTGNGFTKFSGPATTEKTKTLRDATDTILELGGSYTPTGTWTSLTLVTPVLGTPASGVLTNATGLPISSGVSGLGTGVATFLATPSSANLIAAVTDETGSGALVFGTSPTIATPILNGLPTGTGVASAGTASTLAARDSSANLTANNWLGGYATTTTAAGTTTLTVASGYVQFFTGSTTQTVTLPVASTLTLGHQFVIVNNSTGNITVNSSGGNALLIVAGGTSATITCILASGTTAASWNASYGGMSVASGKKGTFSNTLTVAGTDGSTLNVGTGGTLGTNAFTSTAFAPLASPTFTGTVVLPSGQALIAPALGTPASATLTNATGLPIASGVSGLGTGVATFLGTPSGANLASALTTALPVTKGGTGAATLTAHGVVVGNGTSAVAVTGAGTAGQVLTSNGASADPTFQTPSGVIGTAWFDPHTGSIASSFVSGCVASISYNEEGVYDIALTGQADADYTVCVSTGVGVTTTGLFLARADNSRSTTNFTLRIFNADDFNPSDASRRIDVVISRLP